MCSWIMPQLDQGEQLLGEVLSDGSWTDSGVLSSTGSREDFFFCFFMRFVKEVNS
jgi:hypothetical protein